MDAEIKWLPELTNHLEAELRRNNIGTSQTCPNLYAVVGYGRRAPHHKARLIETQSGKHMVLSSEFGKLQEQLASDTYGMTEDGYQALAFAVRRTAYRRCSDIAHIAVLITSEDRDIANSGARRLNRTDMKVVLQRRGFSLSVIVDNPFFAGDPIQSVFGVDSKHWAYQAQQTNTGNGSILPSEDAFRAFRQRNDGVEIGDGNGNTKPDYTDLALEACGAAWDTNILRGDNRKRIQQFTGAFVADLLRQATMLSSVCRCYRQQNIVCRRTTC